MSTRCQVEAKAAGLPFDSEAVVLYHHCDGYPTNMLPLILKAYKAAIAPKKYGRGNKAVTIEHAWQAGRPGKAAAQLCAADPDGFDVEPGTDLHGDIEWFYSVECVNTKGGSTSEIPFWNVTVYTTGPGFWDSPTRSNLTVVANGNITAIGLKYAAKNIEESGRE